MPGGQDAGRANPETPREVLFRIRAGPPWNEMDLGPPAAKGRRKLDDGLAHEPEPDPARLAPVPHLDEPVASHDMPHRLDLLTLARGAPALARLGERGLGGRHDAESSTGSPP